MPVLDMPIEQLRNYYGSSPMPADFDQSWDQAIAEMHALGTNCELIAAPFQVNHARCYDLFFHGVGGARIHAKLLVPVDATPGPAVILYHGLDGASGDWADKLSHVAAGYTIAAVDCRGQTGLSEDTGITHGDTLRGHIIRGLDDAPRDMLYRSIFLDAAQLVRIVGAFSFVDEKRIGVFGGSQGGAITIAAAALEPSVNRLAACHPYLCDYKRVWDMDLAKGAYDDIRRYFRKYDPLHERESEIFTKLGYIDIQWLAERITAKTLFGVGLIDDICPPSTQFAVFNKITAIKEMLVYPDFNHEWYPGYNDKVYQFMLEMSCQP